MNIKITVVFLRSWQFWHRLSRKVCSYKLPFKQSDSKSYYKATVIKAVLLVRDRHKSMQQNRKPSYFGKQLGSSLKKKKKKENLYSITIQHNNYTLGQLSQKNENLHVHKLLLTNMIKAVLFSTVKNWNQPLCLSQVNLTTNYVWCIHVPCCAVLSRSVVSDSLLPHGL